MRLSEIENKLRDYQAKAIKLLRKAFSEGNRKILLFMATGAGKCQHGDTPILMYDGSIELAKNIKIGDFLMGDDSTPRKVLSTFSGYNEMYKMTPIKGDSFIFNKNHIMSLRHSYDYNGKKKGEITDISIKDYFKLNQTQKHNLKWTRTAVDFPEKKVEYDPWFVGLYLAEGTALNNQITNPDHEVISYLKKSFILKTSDNLHYRLSEEGTAKGRKLSSLSKLRREMCSKNDRFIPDRYKINSRKNRLELLAGLLDGDGYVSNNGFEIITKYPTLNQDILYLCRSLGFAAYSSIKIGEIKSINFKGKYFRISISGETSNIPTKIKRKKAEKRKQIKSVLNVGFKLENQGIGKYYGFSIDGNQRYLLGDFSITHNSMIFSYLCTSMLEKNKKVCLVMRRRALVFQASRLFQKFGVDHSIMIGNTKGFDKSKKFQICSIDTVMRRDYSFLENFDAVIYDEGHDTTSQNYQDFMGFFGEKTIHIALTATPFLNAGKAHSWWDVCVKPIEMKDLRAQNYLVDCALFVPSEINLDDVKITKGDYQNKQLGEKMSKLEIVGDVVENYQKYGNGKPGICFAVNKAHSIILCEEFNAQGIRAVHADESTKQKERDKILDQFRKGEIDVLCNVNIFSTGVDLPMAEVGIMARPTRSEILYIQQVGRLLRPYRVCGHCHRDYDNSPKCPHCGYDKPKYIKERAIIIDSGNNQSRHGHPFDDRLPVMSEKDKKERQEKEKPLSKTCKHCFFVYDPYLKNCPNCHKEMELPENLYKTKKGEIVPYDEYAEISAFFNNLVRSQIVNGFKDNWKYFQLYEKFGEKCMKYKDEFGIPVWIPKIIEKQKKEELKDKLITD